MSELKILVTMPKNAVFYTFFDQETIVLLEQFGEIVWNESEKEQFTKAELCKKIVDIDVIITGWGTHLLDEEVVNHANKLKLVCHTGGTVKPYVSDAIYDKGIAVVSGNNVFAESVAESVIAYALASLRDIPKYSTELKQGIWPSQYYNRGLLNKKIGIIGFGMIARYTVNMLKPFHPELYVYTKEISQQDLDTFSLTQVSLEEMFTTCDIISIHLSSTAETYHLINENLLTMMKDGALLINTARGAIIDEKALMKVLNERKNIYAALDVYEVEPLPSDYPLLQLDNAFLMPHMGGPTIDRRLIVTKQIIKEIELYFSGQPPICPISKVYAKLMTG